MPFHRVTIIIDYTGYITAWPGTSQIDYAGFDDILRE
jgi:hypothetical protein